MPLVRVQRRWALVVAAIGMPRAVPTAAADDLFAAADRALYRTKRRGRDRLVLGDDESAA